MFTLVARGPQGYKVVQYIAFRSLDLKEGSDGAHLNASLVHDFLVENNVFKKRV